MHKIVAIDGPAGSGKGTIAKIISERFSKVLLRFIPVIVFALLLPSPFNLDLTNKITMFADTAYRYKFNAIKSYSIEQLGLFQKGENTLEALYFERK